MGAVDASPARINFEPQPFLTALFDQVDLVLAQPPDEIGQRDETDRIQVFRRIATHERNRS